MLSIGCMKRSTLPWERERALARLVEDYNHERLHEAIGNVKRDEMYHGGQRSILSRRERIKSTIFGPINQCHSVPCDDTIQAGDDIEPNRTCITTTRSGNLDMAVLIEGGPSG
jgi:hypothetical protein